MKTTTAITLIICFLFLASCKNNKHQNQNIKQTIYHTNGDSTVCFFSDNELKNGKCSYYQKGKIIGEYSLKNSRKSGLAWIENMKNRISYNYRNDLLEGNSIEHDINGQLIRVVYYTRNIPKTLFEHKYSEKDKMLIWQAYDVVPIPENILRKEGDFKINNTWYSKIEKRVNYWIPEMAENIQSKKIMNNYDSIVINIGTNNLSVNYEINPIFLDDEFSEIRPNYLNVYMVNSGTYVIKFIIGEKGHILMRGKIVNLGNNLSSDLFFDFYSLNNK